MEQFSIGVDFESAATRRNKRERFDPVAEFENFCRQTDGFRRVVSNHAIFNRNVGLHLMLLSGMKLSACVDRSRVRKIGKHCSGERRRLACRRLRPRHRDLFWMG
jgi:hypothetical protein